jgi:hypothetical protein
MKIYNSDDKKYGGEKYETLDGRLLILYDFGLKIGLPESEYHNVFSIILNGRAHDFYYSKIVGKRMDLAMMIALTKTHFETDENHQEFLREWRDLSLKEVFDNNPSKSRLECFQMALDELIKLQRCLGGTYRSERALRDQIVNTCREVPDCDLACFNPAPTVEGVCAQMRSSIGTAARSRAASEKSTFHTQGDPQYDEYDNYEHNWTDRRSTRLRNEERHTISSRAMQHTRRNKMSLPSSTTASLRTLKD